MNEQICLFFDDDSSTLFNENPNIHFILLHREKMPTLPPLDAPFALLIVMSGAWKWPEIVDQYIVHQHVQRNTPLLVFPYCNIAGFLLPQLLPYHPMCEGTQSSGTMNQEKLRSTILIHDTTHPIMQQCKTFACPPSHRVVAEVHNDTLVLASWADNTPMVMIRKNIICLNFCLINYVRETDASRIILQSIEYLLQRKKNNWRLKMLKTITAFSDVTFK